MILMGTTYYDTFLIFVVIGSSILVALLAGLVGWVIGRIRDKK